MNRNILKWILIAAVVLGAAAYLILSETPSKKEPKKEKIVVGHSKAFTIEPIEGITISAPKDALDKNRKFKLEPVSDKTYDKVVKQFENSQTKPVFVFDLDAGLATDDHLPGDFTMTLDLNKLGVPKNLQEDFCVFRMAESKDGMVYYKFLTTLKDGKISFQSNQNSHIVGALDNPSTKLWRLLFPPFETIPCFTTYAHFVQELGLAKFSKPLRLYYAAGPTFRYPVKDANGDFAIYFRYDHTEDPKGGEKYVTLLNQWNDRVEELKKEVEKEQQEKIDAEATRRGLSTLEKYFSSKQMDEICKSFSFNELLDEKMKNDPVLKQLGGSAPQLPATIQYIIESVKKSNKFINDMGTHPLNFELQIYLADTATLGKENDGAAKKMFMGNSVVVFNYKHPQNKDKVLLTLVHELFHVRQQCYYNVFSMSSYAAEATAVALEMDAAKYWYKKGLIHLDPTVTQNKSSVGVTGRDAYYAFGYPLDEISATDKYKLSDLLSWDNIIDKTFSGDDNLSVGYTLASALEGIREGVGKNDKTMFDFVSTYSLYGPHFKGWTGWTMKALGITKDELNKGWKHFGEKFMYQIFSSQEQSIGNSVRKDLSTKILEPTQSHPIIQLKELSKPRDYMVSSYRVDPPEIHVPKKGIVTEDANIFIYNKMQANPYVYFYMLDRFVDTIFDQPGLYSKDQGRYRIGVITTAQSKGDPKSNDYYLVALFAPDAPKITKVKDDHISFVVSKPERVLTKNKFITGAVVTYTDKNGNTQTLDLNPKQFGKRVKWPVANASKKGNAFTLTAHWYYKPDEQTTYVSPESKMAEWGGHIDEQEEPQAEEKAPETNYWKLVNVRMEKTNTSYKESQNPDEEVDADYRSIDFAVDRTEKSCTFMGIAATEEVHEDNTRHYVRDLYLDGTLTFTEPPKFWTPGRQYKAICEVADDPYLLKISEPFVFEAENSSSQPTVCLQSKNDKIDKGWSSLGETNWLRSASTTFEAHSPEKDSPKFFTLTQSYSIAERPYSDLMAKVVLHYDYEWVGEPEEETAEEEPEGGGYWKLVKVYDDNTHAKFENIIDESKDKESVSITGGNSRFNLNAEKCFHITLMKDGKPTFSSNQGTVSQSASITPPKRIYFPEEPILFNYSRGERVIEGKPYDYGLSLHRMYITKPYQMGKRPGFEQIGVSGVSVGLTSDKPTRNDMVAPPYSDRARHFTIVDYATTGSVCYSTIYEYEWVEGEPEDITVERMPFVAYLPESPVAKHIDRWPRQIFYGHDQITTYKEGSGYRVIGVTHLGYGTVNTFESDPDYPGGSYQDRMEITLDKDFNVIRGIFTRDRIDYEKRDNAWWKYDAKMNLQFEKSPDDGKTHKYHYRIVSLDASTRVTTPKDEQFYVLTTGDLQYNWVESDGKDHYDEYGCTPNCTPMDCMDMAKIVSDKDHNVEIDLTIKKQKH